MNLKVMVLVALFLVLALLAACSREQTPGVDERAERLTSYFNEADTNDNGILELAEIDAVADANFDTLDYNGDGVVTIEDIYNEEQALPEGVEPVLDLSHHLPYDLDSDGTITREEYRAYLDAELLAEMDSNGDGQISFAEYRTYEEF